MRVSGGAISCFIKIFLASLCFVSLCCSVQPVSAQEIPKVLKPKASKTKGFRILAPGVETTIPVLRDAKETISTHDIIELIKGQPDLKWLPNHSPVKKTLHSKAQKVTHYQTVWNLEFTFKPLRMMVIDIPQPTKTLKKKLIWYMVFRVKNNGSHLQQIKTKDKNNNQQYVVKSVDDTKVLFFPQFWLEPKDTGKMELIMDQVIPAAIPAIQKREDPKRKLLSTVSISKKAIPLSTKENDNSVWGVATWEDVDPKLDYFSIYVRGLTSAYRWEDRPEQFQKGSPVGKGRTFTNRTLKLNFWRPGDTVRQNEEEIHLGYEGTPAYQWVWRPAFSGSKSSK